MTSNTFQSRLTRCLRQFKENTAIEYGQRRVTYGQLDRDSNYIANLLRAKGIARESLVGILMEDRVRLITAIIGILKAGCVFVPLEPAYPREKLGLMIRSTKIRRILCDKMKAEEFLRGDAAAGAGVEFIEVKDPPADKESPWFTASPAISYDRDDPIYIYFTSGSAGMPKAVTGKNKSLLHFIDWEIETFGIDETFRISQFTTPGFDAFLRDIFTPLCSGGVICIPETPLLIRDAGKLILWLDEREIHLIHCVPALFRLLNSRPLIESHFQHLKFIMLSGDKIYPADLAGWYDIFGDRIQLVNFYGPTETTMIKSYYMINASDVNRESIPIGKSMKGARLMVLDEGLNVCDELKKGEIYIRSPYRTLGYYNNPELTRERFKKNPYSDDPDDLLYRTGDSGRLLADGNIELLGRIDRQVKIQGIRIEPEEIEGVLIQHPSIDEAVVIKEEVSPGNAFLCAFFTNTGKPGTGKEEFLSHLRAYLTAKLPEYMIPAKLVELRKIPRNPNGKVDYDRLYEELKNDRANAAVPVSHIEKKLSEIWREVLECDRVGVNISFFEMGGNSLNLMALLAKIYKEFDVRISLAEIFENNTILKQEDIIIKSAPGRFSTTPAVEKKEYYPVSPAQKRMYIQQQMETGNISYNVFSVFMLSGDFDESRCQEVFSKLIRRHEALRTSFQSINHEHELVQQIHHKAEFELRYCRPLANGEEQAGVETVIKRFIRPFDLSRAPLLQVGVLKTGEGKRILIVDMHHIITDGISQAILLKEFTALYRGEELSPQRIHYKDYSVWRQREEQKENLDRQKDYWFETFGTEPPVLNIPPDYSRPAEQVFEGNAVDFSIGIDKTKALNQLAKKQGTTLYIVLLAVLNVLLAKLSSQEDIVIGTPAAGREHAFLEQIIGMFVNTLAMRNFPAREKKFIHFLAEVKENTLKAFENQYYPFEELVEHVSPNRDISRNPLFDVMFVLQNMEFPGIEIPGLEMVPYEHKHRLAKFDLELYVMEDKEKLLFSFQYCIGLFKRETIEKYISFYKQIISSILNNVNQRIYQIRIIPDEDKKKILFNFNDTDAEYPQNKAIHALFAARAEQTPDHMALIGQNPNPGVPIADKDAPIGPINHRGQIQLTYEELNETSGRLADVLHSTAGKGNIIVGIMMERSIDMIIGIFGILKAGGAYLPIDPGYPPERIRYMLADSSVNILITHPGLSGKFEGLSITDCQLLIVNEKSYRSMSGNREFQGELLRRRAPDEPGGGNGSPHWCPLPAPATSLAYIIYTSGSTGKPKGVTIEHRSVVNRINWMQFEYPIAVGDAILQKTPFTFDVSVWELFWWSFQGASLRLLGPGEEMDPEAIVKAIARSHVTVIHFVPSMLRTFLEYVDDGESRCLKDISNLRQVFSSGEALTVHLVERFNALLCRANNTKLANLYGPTEATVDVSYFNCPPGKKLSRVPIGKPIHNIHLYVVDPKRALQPIGVAGELCISGDGLARGYLNRSGLTAEKFDHDFWDWPDYHDEKKNYKLQNTNYKQKINQKLLRGRPDASRGGFLEKNPPGRRRQKIYKTGDLVRWLEDGNIEFLGRIDHQVKIRGFRIELGEIENQLLSANEIKDAVVEACGDEKGGGYLCAYIVTGNPDQFEPGSIKEFLSRRLPGYMIPTYFVPLEQIPLTPNGKLDRRMLPGPGKPGGRVKGYAPPGNRVEKKLVRLWEEILGADHIGIDDNFFELGGHSLNASRAAVQIHRLFNVKPSLREIFKKSTIRKLARYITECRREKHVPIEAAEKREYYELSPAQNRIYFIYKIESGTLSYNMPKVVLLEGAADRERLNRAIGKLIRRHESLRTSFEMNGDGPVQKVHDHVEFAIEKVAPPAITSKNLDAGGPGEEQRWVEAEAIRAFIRPFDLSRVPLLRVGLLEITAREHILIVDMHHIISDAVSNSIMIGEFMEIYSGRDPGPLPLQYKDFALWQNRELRSGRVDGQETFWLNRLKDMPLLEIPADYPGAARGPQGQTVTDEINETLTARLNQMAVRVGATLYMALLAIFTILLSKYAGKNDIIVGTPVAGRRHADLDNIMGMFINVLIMRNSIEPAKTFAEFLEQVKYNTLQVLDHQDYPFDHLAAKLGLKWEETGNPLYRVIFALQEEEEGELQIPGLILKPLAWPHNTAKTDLRLGAAQKDGKIQLLLTYSTSRFKRDTAEGMLRHYKEILEQVDMNIRVKPGDIRLSHHLENSGVNDQRQEQSDFTF